MDQPQQRLLSSHRTAPSQNGNAMSEVNVFMKDKRGRKRNGGGGRNQTSKYTTRPASSSPPTLLSPITHLLIKKGLLIMDHYLASNKRPTSLKEDDVSFLGFLGVTKRANSVCEQARTYTTAIIIIKNNDLIFDTSGGGGGGGLRRAERHLPKKKVIVPRLKCFLPRGECYRCFVMIFRAHPK